MKSCAVACGVLALSLSTTSLADPGPDHWQHLARQDLDAARELILQAHPGAIDESNPALRDWIDRGYQAASALVPQATSYDAMLAVVRYYVSGFRDGHLIYSDNIRPGNTPMWTTGWRVEHAGGKALVAIVAPDWATPLPPVGSELVDCDGDPPARLVRERVAPYVDRRTFASVHARLAGSLDLLRLQRDALHRCTFIGTDGERFSIDVGYQPLTTDAYWDALVTPLARQSAARENGYSLEDGVLWVRAYNFGLSPEQVARLRTMLKELRALDGYHAIVFDARRNGGGDSSVGDRIFEAATGGLVFDRTGLEALPRVYAQWRVSGVAIDTAREFVERRLAQYGEDSEEVAFARAHLKAFEDARATGQAWVEQPSGYRVDRGEVERRGGRLARFDGTVVLLTDHGCASACLDFADTVLLVPGAIHAGQETSGDAVYIDTGWVTLPSGNGFVIPLKVWRNRLRGNNETLAPDVPIALDASEEAAVRAAVLRIIHTRRDPG